MKLRIVSRLAAGRIRSERGDTLIEVTFALTILSFVLVGSTLLAADAFRLGQTARERTIVSDAAQQQIEALISFRDNHTWAQFVDGQNCGSSGGYCGVASPATQGTSCVYAAPCFHMVNMATAFATAEWVPEPGPVAAAVPTSAIEITTPEVSDPADVVDQGCGFDFNLRYYFVPLGGTTANLDTNQIQTRLVNLSYTPPVVGPVECP